MSEMRYTVKDSVFTYVFKQPEYARKLYLALHPEDTAVTEADCKLVTLENVLTTGMYNDVGLQVRDTLILLVEAQSVFSVNIALRMLLYLAATYKEYTEERKLNLYGTAPVTIPRPELYVVYTGDRPDVPDELRLSELYKGSGAADVEVKVLRGNGTGDIVDQYVRFCKISDEERKKHGRSRKAVEETMRRCIEENVLAPFLATRQKEVAEIMVTLFDQEKIMEIHDYHVAEDARKDGLQQGLQKGLTEGTLQSIRNLITNMGLSVERAMTVLGVSEADQPKYAEMLKQ